MAVFINLIWQVLALRGCETEASEEFRSPSEQARASDPMLSRLGQQRFHQMPTPTFALLRRRNRDGADLRQMRAIEMKRAAADNQTAVFQDDEIAYVLADLGQGSRQQGPVASVGRDQSMDPRSVRQDSLRVRMDVLPDRLDLLSSLSQRLPHSRRCRPARNVVDGKHCLQLQAGVEVLVEFQVH